MNLRPLEQPQLGSGAEQPHDSSTAGQPQLGSAAAHEGSAAAQDGSAAHEGSTAAAQPQLASAAQPQPPPWCLKSLKNALAWPSKATVATTSATTPTAAFIAILLLITNPPIRNQTQSWVGSRSRPRVPPMSPKASWSQRRHTATNFLDQFKRGRRKTSGHDSAKTILLTGGNGTSGWDGKICRLNSLRSVRGLGGLTYHSEVDCQGVRFFTSQMF